MPTPSRHRSIVRKPRRSHPRRLIAESLESRCLLAVDFPMAASPARVETALEAIERPFESGAVSVDQMIMMTRTQPYVSDEVIVAVKGGEEALAETLVSLQAEGFEQVKALEKLFEIGLPQEDTLTLVQVDLGEDHRVTEALRALDGVAGVNWSAPNFIYSGDDARDLIPNDPRYGNQWHHGVMQNPLGWDVSLGDPSIVIGVTDDGIDLDHPDLDDALWTNLGEIAGNGIDDDNNGYVDDVNGYNFLNGNHDVDADAGDSHGTHVAGIAAAEINNAVGVAGTAGGATIMPLKWYDGGSWTSAIVAETFTYAADNGADIVNSSYNMDIWATNPVVMSAFQYMYDAGVLHFNSAGNSGTLNPVRQVFEQTLFVANTNSSDVKSGSSNYGDGIDVAAPGSSIHSTLLGGYGNLSGTSMAAPNAAGVAALIWSANPTWSREQVVAQLLGTSDNIDAQNSNYVGLLGAGRVNSGRALTETLAAPQVMEIDGLPTGGVVAAANSIAGFSVRFNQLMDAATITDAASYDLRSPGTDGVYDTADDTVFTLIPPDTYMIGTNEVEVDIDGPALGIGQYRMRLVSGGLQNPFGTDLDGNGDGVAGDHIDTFFDVNFEPTQRTWLPGSGASVSMGNASSLVGPADTDQFTLFVEPGETITAVIRPDSNVTVTGEFVALGGSVSAAQAGQPVVVPLTVGPGTGQVTLQVSADGATDYQFDVFRNVNAEALVESADVITLSGTTIDFGSQRFSAVGQTDGEVGSQDVDEFALQLNAGSEVDLVLIGQSSSFAAESLLITDDMGSVLATASAGVADNYDLGLLGFVVPESGEYRIRLDASMAAEYELLLAENALFDTESPPALMQPTRALDPVVGAVGYLEDRPFSYTRVQHTGSFVDISATGTALGLGDNDGATITTTVGNALMPAGTVTISNNGAIVAGTTTASRSNLPLPNFGFTTALLPFWDDLNSDSGDVYWEERQVDGVDTLIVQWEDRPHRNSGVETLTFQAQLFATGPVLARFAYEDVELANAALTGAKSATVGIQQTGSVALQFSYNTLTLSDGDVIDFLAVEQDRYAFTVDADITMAFSTGTPFDQSAGNLENSLNPGLQVRDAAGNVLAVDSDSLDGHNATLEFTALAPGTYYVEVTNEGMEGEYVLFSRRVPNGDFDFDGDFDGTDLDLLTAAIAAGTDSPDFELTGDRAVDLDDRDAWLAIAGAANLPSGNPYLLGDANLDGTVDGQDFVQWNIHKFTSVAAWTAGDFNADGSVNGQDFVLWNLNKFTSADDDRDEDGSRALAMADLWSEDASWDV